MEQTKIIVVGNGMVGHKFIDALLAQPEANIGISIFCAEPRLAYDRVQLTSYFSGSTEHDLALTDEQYYQEHDVQYRIGDKVTTIDRHTQQVTTQSGHVEHYDKLILATGSYPFVPEIPGNEQPHCHVYRTIEDLQAIEASSKTSQSGVVIGGGLLGLEAANALKSLGLKTHVVEFAPRLMAAQLDQGGGELLQRKIEQLDVAVHLEKATTEIVAGETQRYCMKFADGSHVETDMIVFSAGIRPQDELGRQAGLEIGPRGGVVINDLCQTSDHNIYAIGECALWQQKIFGLVAPGYQMAKVAAKHITQPDDEALTFSGADMSTKLKLLGVDVASIGDVHGQTEGAQSYTYHDEIAEVYKRLIISADGKQIVGAVLVGDTDAYGTLLQSKLNDLPLPENPAILILPNVVQEDSAAIGVDALPDSAVVCSCFDVCKGVIKEAVVSGCSTMSELKATTNASTGCGGCSALAKQILDNELVQLGMEVNNNLCEHFAFSRQELTDIIRIKKIETFQHLLDEYGQGLGCDVCKPAIGSILAAYWNEYILKDEHIELQDTNDIYLGNMQKDGTYSIVPRIAAGEITPDKLITLGSVAKEYDLYTKITGGQRIDLFGAQLHQLPEIWQKLVDAGFETGHAYGKSVRTVKLASVHLGVGLALMTACN